MRVFVRHFATSEANLLAKSKIPASSGHSSHRGTPREAFVREFLEEHLGEYLAIGTGEIIDGKAEVDMQRPQLDVVVYRREYPRLHFRGRIHGFLVESVVATIEVKSTLDKPALAHAIRTTHTVKNLQPSLFGDQHWQGWKPRGPLSFVVAYNGPASMQTVHGWLDPIHASQGIAFPPIPAELAARSALGSPSLDGIFVLGRGFLLSSTTPGSFPRGVADRVDSVIASEHFDGMDTPHLGLKFLFLALAMASTGLSGTWLDTSGYLKGFDPERLSPPPRHVG